MTGEPLDVLLDRLRDGDETVAGQIVADYEPYLRMVVRRCLPDRLRAKFDSLDVVQSVWVHVLHDLRHSGCHIASTDHLRHFLVRVTRNCMIGTGRPLTP